VFEELRDGRLDASESRGVGALVYYAFEFLLAYRYRYVIPYDKKTRVEIECKLIRIVNSELRLKGGEGQAKPADGWSPRAESLCLSSVLMLSIIG
jgi:hypothetical protein